MRRSTLLLSGLLLLAAAPASAQIAWDAPWLVPPGPAAGMGLYLMDAYGGGLGFLGTWRSPTRQYGLRAGLADTPQDDLGGFGGIDFSGRVSRASYDFPLDVDWVFGAGIGVGSRVRLSVPFGLNLGHTFVSEDATFTPYLTPRLVLDAAFAGGRREHTNSDLDFVADIGLDVRLPRTRFLLRFGGTLGRDAVAFGIVF